MKLKNVLRKTIVIVAVVVAIVSCDNDFNAVGNEVIGDVNFEKKIYTTNPVAYSKKFERVQANSLPASFMGVYNDPFYGQSLYNVLSQVVPESFNPNFGENATLTSVILNLPYYSTETGTSSENVKTYKLDSVYGNTPINLSIYKSNYFLRDFDPASESGARQLYYSDFISQAIEDEAKKEVLITVPSFVPSNAEIEAVVPKKDTKVADNESETLKLSPRLRVPLEPEIFKTNILDMQGKPELDNAINFRNFFRGIYFKTELVNNSQDGTLVLFDMSQANITLRYTYDKDVISDGVTSKVATNGEFKINFSNNIVNAIKYDSSTGSAEPGELDSDVDENAMETGKIDAKNALYLRGGNGFVGVLDLFNKYVQVDDNGDFVLDGNQQPIIVENPVNEQNKKTELDYLKSADWLVNDAILTLYVNKNKISGGDTEPERIYIFDIETGQILFDYTIDPTKNDGDPVNSLLVHLGKVSRGSDKKGEFYQIRITNHLISVLNGNRDNVKLGVAVSQNVNNSAIGNAIVSEKDEIIPISSIMSHEGTAFYGYGNEVPESKRLKLDIFYTKSKN